MQSCISRLSPLGHVPALQELAQRCFLWAVLLLWLEHLFAPEHLCLQLESQVLQIPGLWSHLGNHCLSCSAEADEIW